MEYALLADYAGQRRRWCGEIMDYTHQDRIILTRVLVVTATGQRVPVVADEESHRRGHDTSIWLRRKPAFPRKWLRRDRYFVRLFFDATVLKGRVPGWSYDGYYLAQPANAHIVIRQTARRWFNGPPKQARRALVQ
jgi:hypothetical protein